MKRSSLFRVITARLQLGAVAVEFALTALFLLTLLVGIIELGRAFFYMNAAAQATRLGARMAVVCDESDPRIKERMRAYLTLLQSENISIVYSADGRFVTVQVAPGSTKFVTLIPFVPLTWTLPPFSTTLPRESMSSEGNPVCKPPWGQPSWTPL